MARDSSPGQDPAVKISARLSRIKPSATLGVTARAAELRAAGHDVIGLGAGEPDFDTPAHIKDAAKRALDEGFTKYTAVDGIQELKDAIIAKLGRDNGLEYKRAQILVSNGAKHVIYNLCQALLDAGDEVIIPAPYWVSYPDITLMAHGVPVIVYAGPEQGYKITAAQLEAAITPRTRLLILNSPCNPSGATFTRQELVRLGEVLARHPEVVVATDDIYEKIYWGEEPFANIVMAAPRLYERTVVVDGVSKTYAMTGWRIGYAAGPEPLIQGMKKVQEQITSNPSSISQRAAVAALTGDQHCVTEMAREFRRRHAWLNDALNALPGVRCVPATGAFYAFPDCRGAIGKLGLADDTALCDHLIRHGDVALVPGSAFGAPGHVRLSYATSLEVLQEALRRIGRVLTA
jgi:aspartate aminotransferase